MQVRRAAHSWSLATINAAVASARCSTDLKWIRRRTPTTLERRGGSRVGSGRAVLDRLFEPLADLAAARRPDQLLDVGSGREARRWRIARRWEPRRHASASTSRNRLLSTARAGRHRRRDGDLHLRQRANLPVRAGKLRPDPTEQRRELLNVSAASGYRGAVPPACAVNCAVIVTAHDASGDTGQNCEPGILQEIASFGLFCECLMESDSV